MDPSERPQDEDPAPLEHVDAERVTDEEAAELPEGSTGETARAEERDED